MASGRKRRRTWTWFLYNKKTSLGPRLRLGWEAARLVFGGSHPLAGTPELGEEQLPASLHTLKPRRRELRGKASPRLARGGLLPATLIPASVRGACVERGQGCASARGGGSGGALGTVGTGCAVGSPPGWPSPRRPPGRAPAPAAGTTVLRRVVPSAQQHPRGQSLKLRPEAWAAPSLCSPGSPKLPRGKVQPPRTM